jgi:hypothetical protein
MFSIAGRCFQLQADVFKCKQMLAIASKCFQAVLVAKLHAIASKCFQLHANVCKNPRANASRCFQLHANAFIGIPGFSRMSSLASM